MKHRPFQHLFNFKGLYIFIILLLYASTLNTLFAQTQKPNIILILADDVGYKSLTCNGGNLYSTPNIDMLAQQGMRFTQCFSSPSCSPSRYMLLTGKYNFRNYTEWGIMPSTEKTVGNMMKDAGYKTGFFGKAQLGNNYFKEWGFDSYCVHGVFGGDGLPYKNPQLFTHDNFLPDSLTKNKYGPDIVSDSVIGFITNNRTKPFFIYYPLELVHAPWCPTPDDAAFKAWHPLHDKSDTSFYPSMMSYMDKKIGELVQAVKDLGIEKNTLIMFAGDNGTSGRVSDYDSGGDDVEGGKSSTTSAGIHVPLIAYWPGTINFGTLNSNLVDFTDFFPTVAGIANISLPTDYGVFDGVSFAPAITGKNGIPRNWVFNYYDPRPFISIPARWAQTNTYKLYDTSAINSSRLFYKIVIDSLEQHPIPDNLLTDQENLTKQNLLDIINGFIAQGFANLDTPEIASTGSFSASIINKINANGGSAITSSGVVWGEEHNPILSSNNYTSGNDYEGNFYSFIKNLTSNTTYYVRTYTTNAAGITYSEETFFTTKPQPPVAQKASQVQNNGFVANWTELSNVDNYQLDVSTSPDFTAKAMIPSLTEGFNNGNIPQDWACQGKHAFDWMRFGKTAPSVALIKSGSYLITPQYPQPVTKLSFWVKSSGKNDDNAASLLVEGFDGIIWQKIDLFSFYKKSVVKIYDFSSAPALKNNYTQFRFTLVKWQGTNHLFIDDIAIDFSQVIPSFISGFEKLTVKADSQLVNKLDEKKLYYYRVRSQNNSGVSDNSNVISVNLSAPDSGNKALFVNIFPNPSNDEFNLTVLSSDIQDVVILVTDVYGNKVYQSSGKSQTRFTFGKNFPSGSYFVQAIQGGVKKTIKVIKSAE